MKKLIFKTEVEVQDANGGVETKEVTTEMPNAAALAAAEAAYIKGKGHVSHQRAVEIGLKASK